MAGLIQQLTDITLTATPSVGSYLLSIDLDGVLKYKTDTGTISLVGFGGGSTNVNVDEIAFGSPTGLTSSQSFLINGNEVNLIFGSNSISGGSTGSVILGGFSNTITAQSEFSAIVGGQYNTIYNNNLSGYLNLCSNSFIAGGIGNIICNCSASSGILSSLNSCIDYSQGSSLISTYNSRIYSCSGLISLISSANSCVYDTSKSSILAGDSQIMSYSQDSVILGGCCNRLYCSQDSSILGGQYSEICNSNNSIILSGVGTNYQPYYGVTGGNRYF